MNTVVLALIRPSATFSQREKALCALALSLWEHMH